MRNLLNQRAFFYGAVITLSFFLMGQTGPVGQGPSNVFNYLLIIIVIMLIPIFKAYNAAKSAQKFKTLIFVSTFIEWFGWILCITIIGIPIGLGLVLSSQAAGVLIQIENNTGQATELLKSLQKSRQDS